MSDEMRNTLPPTPTNCLSYLNPAQKTALKKFSAIGWRMAFIRRPLFEEPTVVIESAEARQYAILEPNGQLTLNSDLGLRPDYIGGNHYARHRRQIQ